MVEPYARAPRRLRGRHSRARGAERGAVAVEFGLIAPLLILLVLGLIDFGWMFSRDTVVNNVARDAARVASLSGSYSDISSTITGELSSYGVSPSDVTFAITCVNASGTNCSNNATSYNTNATSGSTVVVTINYTHQLMTPISAVCSIFGGGCISNTKLLVKTAEMVRE